MGTIGSPFGEVKTLTTKLGFTPKEFGSHLFMPVITSNNNKQQCDNNNSILIQMFPEIKIAKICVSLSHEIQADSCSRAVIHV